MFNWGLFLVVTCIFLLNRGLTKGLDLLDND